MAAPSQLSRKLLSGLALGLGLASLVFLAVFMQIYRAQLSHERGNASEQVNRLLQVSLENAMLKRDLPGLQEIVTRLGHQPNITSVRIVNPQRYVRFASNPAEIDRILSFAELGCADCQDGKATPSVTASTQMVTDASGREVLRSVNPIANKPACHGCHGEATEHPINGILVVDHDAASLRPDAMRAAAALSGAGLLVTLMGLGSVWVMLKRKVLAPIQALDTTSRRLAAGDLNARVAEPEGGQADELVHLCRSFNGMAETIEHNAQEMQRQEQFLQSLIDTVPDGVRVIDETYTVIMANRSYARQALADPAELIGIPCYRLHGRTERCPPTLITCPFHAITEDAAPIRYVHRHVRSDGSEVHVETTAARLTIEKDGRRRQLIVEAIRDLEQQIKYSHEQRLSEIGQLAAGVAHEIYNPLASVRLGLQAVLRRANEALDTETRGYLSMVDGEVDKCIQVTKRLLDLSQVPSQSVQLVSFSNIIPDVISLLHYEAEQSDVRLTIDIGTEDLRVFATDAELRMLVLNLAQNAFHAMPGGGELHITGRHDGANVVVTFRDTGVGISPDAVSHIFDPFYSKRADGVSGTGLGLTICKAIVTRYQGQMSVESQLGAGTTFTVAIPRADGGKAIS